MSRHGEAREGRRTPEYRTWVCMRTRCFNPCADQWPHYGGRGITVCDRWASYEAFLADVGRRPAPKHTLDRIDVNGHYEPGNVRWATPSEQALNRRRGRVLELNGERLHLSEWAARAGMTPSTLLLRLNRGWTLDEAINTPKRGRGRPRILSAELRAEIAAAYGPGVSMLKVARRYGVSAQTVCNAVNGPRRPRRARVTDEPFRVETDAPDGGMASHSDMEIHGRDKA